MKKRLRGLLALCMVACMMLAATTTIASAGTSHYFKTLLSDTKIFSGDTVWIGSGAGEGFALCNESGDYIHDPSAESSVYDQTHTLVSGMKCFADSDNYYSVVFQNIPGYTNYRYAQCGTFDEYYRAFEKLFSLYLAPVPIKYTVSYDVNDGSGSVSPSIFTYDKATGTISDGSGLTKGDLKLKVWNTKRDGTGEPIPLGAKISEVQATIAENAQKLTNTDGTPTDQATITLYAQWDTPAPADKSPVTGDSDITMAALLLILTSAATAGAFLFRRKPTQR